MDSNDGAWPPTVQSQHRSNVLQASFKALNVESDDEVDEEPDNTKELQIEEALKFYQTALKFQSQGEKALKETEEAYRELFESEVFNYPESLSEYNRVQKFGEPIEEYGNAFAEPRPGVFIPAATSENAPSTLPQVLHVSYKNRGQFRLDALRAALQANDRTETVEVVRRDAAKALDDFAEALDKDGDDVDTWRRAARVSQMLGSLRTSRFCLEAIVDGDEQGTDDILGDAGIDIKLADQDLRALIGDVGDVIAVEPLIAQSETLPPTWRKRLALYKDFPDLSPVEVRQSEEVTITARPTWVSVGESILARLQQEREGSPGGSAPGNCIKIQLMDRRKSSTKEVSPTRRGKSDDSEVAVSDTPIRQNSDALPTAKAAGEETSAQDATDLVQSPATTTLPTRKRTSETAELPENADDGRVRSKRLRARQSMAGDMRDADGKIVDNTEFELKIKETTQGDDWLFELWSPLLKRLGVNMTKTSKPYRQVVRKERPITGPYGVGDLRMAAAVNDMYDMMQNWDAAKTRSISEPGQARDTSAGAGQSALLAHLEQSGPHTQHNATDEYDEGLGDFVEQVNATWSCTSQVALEWLHRLISSRGAAALCETSYVRIPWTSQLKQVVSQLATALDHLLRQQVEEVLLDCESQRTGEPLARHLRYGRSLELAQTLFELHLDLFASVNNTSGSEQDQAQAQAERQAREDRLNVWSELSRQLIPLGFENGEIANFEPAESFMLTRHLWASVSQMHLLGEASREHTVLCLNELKRQVQAFSDAGYSLPNSSVNPHLTPQAADKEISKLETVDFFYGVFQKDMMSPVDLIERLEPLLETTVKLPAPLRLSHTERDQDGATVDNGAHASQTTDGDLEMAEISSPSRVLAQFFEKASPSLRLLLWVRLREAYEAIDYPSKVLYINIRCIEVMLDTLTRETYLAKSTEDRYEILLHTIRDLREILTSIWNLLMDSEHVFDCFDADVVRASLQITSDLWMFLYSVALFDDYTQLGGKGGSNVNPFRVYPNDTFHNASILLHNMQVETSVLLYKLLCEAMLQIPELFPAPAEERLTYLRYVHYHFGMRRICKARDSSFLLFMKDELMLRIPEVEQESSNDLAQVLYDLYELHCFSGPSEKQDHGCDSDYLHIDMAKQLVDFVLDKASRINVNQLLKSELGKTVEKLHSTLDWAVKSQNLDAKRNARFYAALFRSPILPVDLYQSVKGISDIPAIPVHPDEAVIASKGWFYLKGQLSLAKYRAARSKGNQGPEEELELANNFFLQDLEYNPERWETWFRLAQTQNYLLDEDILWSAESMNNKLAELLERQKAAIHSYVMAVAVAMRNAEASSETSLKIGELYAEFAMLLYSSTREPFSMLAFRFDEYPEKYYSGADLHTGRMFRPLSSSSAWKFAAVLLRKAAVTQPKDWLIYYYHFKCLWKLHSKYARGRETSRAAVLKALKQMIEALPERKDQKQEPNLDAIYKVISTVHKLVTRGEMSGPDGDAYISECLDAQKQMDASRKPQLSESASWDGYVIELLKLLRNADKPRWHHRFVLRAAQLMRRQHADAREGATAAKEYLVDQHIYSVKTMAFSIWKPEPERPGRRFVYMTRYALFLSSLLEETDDLEGIQLLAKRVRKKVTDFAEHVELWTTVVDVHLKLHRRHAKAEPGCAEVIFRHVDQEEFQATATRIDQWIAAPTDDSPLYEVLREVAELKKLNAGLIKYNAIDDLIGDAYAMIWAHLRPKVEDRPPPASTPQQQASRAASAAPEVKAEAREESRNVMSLTSMMNVDGAEEARATPSGMPPPQQQQTQLQPDGTAFPVRTRSRLISRREWVKRAGDAILARPVAPRPASPAKQAASTADTTHIQVVIEPPRSSGDSGPGEEGPTVPSSVPGSVHDSADDESELSEIEEEEDEEEEGGEGDEEEEGVGESIVVKTAFAGFTAASHSNEPLTSERGGGGAAAKAEGDRMEVD